MLLTCLISGTARRMCLWANSVQAPVRGLRVAVLIIYIFSCLGVPVGDWSSPTTQTGITSSCRCSLKSQRSGQCCCAKAQATGSQGGCCSARAKSIETNSCCSAKTTSPTNSRSKTTKSQLPSLKSTCDCGPSDVAGLIVCREPRILSSISSAVEPRHSREFSRPSSTIVEVGERTKPPLPPPKWSSV